MPIPLSLWLTRTAWNFKNSCINCSFFSLKKRECRLNEKVDVTLLNWPKIFASKVTVRFGHRSGLLLPQPWQKDSFRITCFAAADVKQLPVRRFFKSLKVTKKSLKTTLKEHNNFPEGFLPQVSVLSIAGPSHCSRGTLDGWFQSGGIWA